jgi:hypothetical protein
VTVSPFFFLLAVTPSSVSAITAPLPPNHPAQRDQAGNTVGEAVPVHGGPGAGMRRQHDHSVPEIIT